VQSPYDERGQNYAQIHPRDGLEGQAMIDQIGRNVHGRELLRMRTDAMTERRSGYDKAGQRYGRRGGALNPATLDGTVLVAGRLYDPSLARFLRRPY
jgi:hypothetical protein